MPRKCGITTYWEVWVSEFEEMCSGKTFIIIFILVLILVLILILVFIQILILVFIQILILLLIVMLVSGRYLQDEARENSVVLDQLPWDIACCPVQNIPIQHNHLDCGPFVCAFGDYSAQGKVLEYSTCQYSTPVLVFILMTLL